MKSHSPPFDKVTSSSSRRTLQTTPQDSNHHTVTLPEGQDESVGLDESEKARPYDILQDPLSEQHWNQSSGRVSRRPSHRSTVSLEPPPSTPINPQSFDIGELQRGQAHNQVHGYLGGAGRSLQSTLGDRNGSRDVSSGKDSGERSARDGDKGRSRPGARLNDLESSRMLLIFIPIYPIPDLVPIIANTTQKGSYPTGPDPKSFRTSFHFTLRSGRWA